MTDVGHDENRSTRSTLSTATGGSSRPRTTRPFASGTVRDLGCFLLFTSPLSSSCAHRRYPGRDQVHRRAIYALDACRRCPPQQCARLALVRTARNLRPTASAEKWLAMQSLDNQILIFGADSFKQNVRPPAFPPPSPLPILTPVPPPTPTAQEAFRRPHHRRIRVRAPVVARRAVRLVRRRAGQHGLLGLEDVPDREPVQGAQPGHHLPRVVAARDCAFSFSSSSLLSFPPSCELGLTLGWCGPQSKLVTSSWDSSIKLWD